MVIRRLFQAPIWINNIINYGKNDDIDRKESYDYVRKMIKSINRAGRVKVEVDGTNNLPEHNGFLLCPNHQGLFDMLAIIEASEKPLSVVLKKEASEYFFVKDVIKVLKAIALNRNDMKESIQMINKVSSDMKKGINYVIFPEGTRSKDGNNLLEFKSGTFKAAMKSGSPIVPVALIDCFKPFDIQSIKKETVKVIFLEPLYKEQYVGLNSSEIAYLVHDKIQKKIYENKG